MAAEKLTEVISRIQVLEHSFGKTNETIRQQMCSDMDKDGVEEVPTMGIQDISLPLQIAIIRKEREKLRSEEKQGGLHALSPERSEHRRASDVVDEF